MASSTIAYPASRQHKDQEDGKEDQHPHGMIVASDTGGRQGTTLPARERAGIRRAQEASSPLRLTSTARDAALTTFYMAKVWPTWSGNGSPTAVGSRAACPLHVLGAQRLGTRLRVYAVVHCSTVLVGHCDLSGSEYTNGLVADLVGRRVVHYASADAVDYEGEKAQIHALYPASLRGEAFADIDRGGPTALRQEAARLLGCPTLGS